MLTHVLLPQGLGVNVNFRQSFIGTPGATDFLINEAVVDKSNLIIPVAHTSDGSYTELLIGNWHGNTIRVQSSNINNQLNILITPVVRSENIHYHIELEAGMLWNGKGLIEKQNQTIVATINNKNYVIRSTGKPVESWQPYLSPYLIFDGDSSIGFYTGASMSLNEVTRTIERAKASYESNAAAYGNLSESFKAIQTVLGWNTIYDAEQKRVITPVSRAWNKAWQGFVLFEWDTFFASYLFGMFDKDLAYSNAIAVTKSINTKGHIGHWQMPGRKTAVGMSQPPVGSMICWKLYEKYHDDWFLQEVYDELLTWNRWWDGNRNYGGALSWGGWKGAEPQIAAWESGMDNSPMYDHARMKDTSEYALQNIHDVGLNSLYINDCRYLGKIAKELHHDQDLKEIEKREMHYKNKLRALWNDSLGIYLNHYTDSAAFSYRLSPTLFYPMLAGVPEHHQADRMLQEHFYNRKEFYSDLMVPSVSFNDPDYNNDYWKGSIWPPLNFLVYLGLRDYDRVAAKDLADKSFQLFSDAWVNHGKVFENINSSRGILQTISQSNSDPYYHWGALMGIMEFIESDKY